VPKNPEDLTEGQARALAAVDRETPRLWRAYNLEERFREVFGSPDPARGGARDQQRPRRGDHLARCARDGRRAACRSYLPNRSTPAELVDAAGIDIPEAMHAKIARDAEKYPVTKARGTSKKYTELWGDQRLFKRDSGVKSVTNICNRFCS